MNDKTLRPTEGLGNQDDKPYTPDPTLERKLVARDIEEFRGNRIIPEDAACSVEQGPEAIGEEKEENTIPRKE